MEIREEEEEEEREPTLGELFAAVRATKDAGEKQATLLLSEMADLRAENASLRGGAPPGVNRLEALCNVLLFPTNVSNSCFTASELARLPPVLAASATVPMLDVRQHPLVVAVERRASERKTDGASSALLYELPPLLTVQSVGLMAAAVMKQITDDLQAQTLDFDTLASALTGSLSYLVTWSNWMISTRVNEIAALLQYDAAAAAKWAALNYGPQNTLLDDSPAASAFRLMQATEPPPARLVGQASSQADKLPQGRGRGAGGRGKQQQQQQQQQQQGRGRGRGAATGGYQYQQQQQQQQQLQQSKGGAEKAPPPAQ